MQILSSHKVDGDDVNGVMLSFPLPKIHEVPGYEARDLPSPVPTHPGAHTQTIMSQLWLCYRVEVAWIPAPGNTIDSSLSNQDTLN